MPPGSDSGILAFVADGGVPVNIGLWGGGSLDLSAVDAALDATPWSGPMIPSGNDLDLTPWTLAEMAPPADFPA